MSFKFFYVKNKGRDIKRTGLTRKWEVLLKTIPRLECRHILNPFPSLSEEECSEKYMISESKQMVWTILAPPTFDKWNWNKKEGLRPDSTKSPAEIHYHNNLSCEGSSLAGCLLKWSDKFWKPSYQTTDVNWKLFILWNFL